MPINSRDKGAVGERELAQFLRDLGVPAVRGQQRSGSPDSPDVKCDLTGIHLECKRVEERSAGTIYEWLAQAQRDSDGSGKIPVVAHRRNRKDWVAILPLKDLIALVQDLQLLARKV
jgi:Holliday junction resolvase